MGDPLSITAGAIGVVTAAVQVTKTLTDFTKRVKDGSKAVKIVIHEVEDMHTIITQFQPLLLGLEKLEDSWSSHEYVKSVVTILIGCLATFSELQQLVVYFKTREFRLSDRFKWVANQTAVAALLARLQAHKSSLSLILIIFNGYVSYLPFDSSIQ